MFSPFPFPSFPSQSTMRSGLLFLLLLPLANSETPSVDDVISPLVEKDKGASVIQFWKDLQNDPNGGKDGRLPYDVDACYGWIGRSRPKKGEYIGLALTPNCFIIRGDLLTFYDTFMQATASYTRYSEEHFNKRGRCLHHHLFIARLHRLDEGGMFSYHYTRVRMLGNKLEVTFFALKDVLDDEQLFSGTYIYEHPSVKFQNADKFAVSYQAFLLYTIDYEIYVWFKSKEGLRLINYRLTWDSRNSDNGYHVDVYQEFAIPNSVVPEAKVAYIMTSSEENHYFFVQNGDSNEHSVFILKHTDLIKSDFTRMELFDAQIPVDVYPRGFLDEVMPYYSLSVYRRGQMFENKCSNGPHVEFYMDKKVQEDGTVKNYLPDIVDPPLALNIFATHYRSSYPFVKNGRRTRKPRHYELIGCLGVTVLIFVFARWIVLGYDVLPTSIARWIRLKSKRNHYIFKRLATKKNSQFHPLFNVLFKLEKLIRKGGRKLYSAVRWILHAESNEDDEETRVLIQTVGQDHVSSRDATTPNE